MNKNHRYIENKKYRMSDYAFRKWWNLDEWFSIFRAIKCRKYSRYQHLRDTAYDAYMVDGLCYGKFYGLEKISHLRLKYLKSIRKIKRKYNAIN